MHTAARKLGKASKPLQPQPLISIKLIVNANQKNHIELIKNKNGVKSFTQNYWETRVFILRKLSPQIPQNKKLNTIVLHNYSNMHASLSNFNLFLKTLPPNKKALGGKSFPLTFNGKNYN